jgi:hypothetical protein
MIQKPLISRTLAFLGGLSQGVERQVAEERNTSQHHDFYSINAQTHDGRGLFSGTPRQTNVCRGCSPSPEGLMVRIVKVGDCGNGSLPQIVLEVLPGGRLKRNGKDRRLKKVSSLSRRSALSFLFRRSPAAKLMRPFSVTRPQMPHSPPLAPTNQSHTASRPTQVPPSHKPAVLA